MIFFKIIYRLNVYFKLLIFKLIYLNKFRIGKNLSFRKGFTLVIEGKNAKVKIGNNCFFNNYCTIAAQSHITIGDNTIFGENVKIYDHNHNYIDHNKLIKHQGYSTDHIEIGQNCWIASNVIILKGVKIGDNCVIGAGCIVHKDISSNSIVLCKQEKLIRLNNE
jgi:acetyltransferase-like isoleucine patch superfamily enzyme